MHMVTVKYEASHLHLSELGFGKESTQQSTYTLAE